MEISSQIRKYRLESNLSQEDLAEKIFVTRQTISNWENGKNYPDLNSLVLLGSFFDVSLDILIKGDLIEMKEQIKTDDSKKVNLDGTIFFILLAVTAVSAVPLFLYLDLIGITVWVALAGTMCFYGVRLEKQKKKHNIQTYKEILAFIDGKTLDDDVKKQEQLKRPYQAALSAIISGVVTAIIGGIFIAIYLATK